MGASVELRCDCSRRRTQAASRIDVFPWPLRATRKLNPGENSIPSSSKHRKFRNCRSASITITELIAQPCHCHLEPGSCRARDPTSALIIANDVSCNSLKIRYPVRWGERVNHSSYIASRLEASRSGDFQSPFVNGWAISNRLSLVHVIPAPKITLAFSNSSG